MKKIYFKNGLIKPISIKTANVITECILRKFSGLYHVSDEDDNFVMIVNMDEIVCIM